MMKLDDIRKKVDFMAEAGKLEAEHRSGTDKLLETCDFNVDVRVENGTYTPREHICSADEFTYVLYGEVNMKVGDEITTLTAGQGFWVKAGVRHKTMAKPGASWLLVSKTHKHHYFE